jgi:hypothetical protein
VERSGATILLDEAERLNARENPELAELLRAGYKLPSYAIRVQEPNFEPRLFEVFGPKAIASIRGIEDVLGSRCIPIGMVRTLDPLKGNRSINVRSENWQEIRSWLYRFALDHFKSVKDIYAKLQNGTMPLPIQGRNFELWSPILAIAAFVEKKGRKGLTAGLTQLARRRTAEQKTTSLSDWDTAILLAIYELKKDGKKVIKTKDVIEKSERFVPEEEPRPNSKYVGSTIKRFDLGKGRKVMGIYHYQIPLARVVDRMKRYDVVYKEPETKERDKAKNRVLRKKRKRAF